MRAAYDAPERKGGARESNNTKAVEESGHRME